MTTDHHRFKVGRAWIDIFVTGEIEHRDLAKFRAYFDLAFSDLDDAARADATLDAGSAIELAERERGWLRCRGLAATAPTEGP